LKHRLNSPAGQAADLPAAQILHSFGVHGRLSGGVCHPPEKQPPCATQHKPIRHLEAEISTSQKLIFSSFLTHLIDSEGTLVAGADLSGAASGEVEQLDEPRNHLVLLLCVTQTPVATEAPAEDSLLRVQHQL